MNREPITIEGQARVIERWKVENSVKGRDYVARNSGTRRSAEKRALLRALVDAAEGQKQRKIFAASF